jgi:glycolate dehydrogenase FAD-linked subunit
MFNPEIIEKLEDIVGRDGIHVNPDQPAAHGHDVGREGRQVPEVMVFPSDVGQISAIMVLANRENVTVLPEGPGGRRSLSSTFERTLVLSTLKMNRILDMDPESLKVTLEAGVTLGALRDALDQVGLYFPPYPWCFEGSTLGGCAANGIGGPASSRHGVFKQYVLGMEVVLPSGEVTRIGGQTVKNVVGYDLASLFCGSEGTLGVIASMTLRLVSKPRTEKLLIMGFETPASACAAMQDVVASGRGPERIAMLDPWMNRKMASFSPSGIPWGQGATVLCEMAGLEEVVASENNIFLELMTQQGGTLIKTLQNPSETEAVWHAQGLCLSAINDAAPTLITWDIMVPRAKAIVMMDEIEKIADQRHLNLVHGGYYGNGVFHPVALIPENHEITLENALRAFRELASFALSIKGNCAGPFRRVGIETAKFHEPQDSYMQGLVLGIKRALDPKGIMKPLPLSLSLDSGTASKIE